MHPYPRGRQRLADIPPAGAALQRKLAITVRAMLGQPHPHRFPRRRPDLAPMHQPIVVDIVERDLLPVHVQTAYHRHQRDLLELLKNFSDAHINERLSRGGPHHMSSFICWLALAEARRPASSTS